MLATLLLHLPIRDSMWYLNSFNRHAYTIGLAKHVISIQTNSTDLRAAISLLVIPLMSFTKNKGRYRTTNTPFRIQTTFVYLNPRRGFTSFALLSKVDAWASTCFLCRFTILSTCPLHRRHVIMHMPRIHVSISVSSDISKDKPK